MLENNNKEVIKRLASRFMKQNKLRNRIFIIAIILTTVMFTTIFGIGFSIAGNLSDMMIRERGTIATIELENPTTEQISQIKNIKGVRGAGISVDAGKLDISDGERKYRINFIFHDNEDFTVNVKPAIENMKGKYPQQENEIMLSEDALTAMGIVSPEPGMDIVFPESDEKYILSGYFKNYSFRTNSFDAFVSEKYLNRIGLSAQKDGVLNISAKYLSGDSLADKLSKTVELKSEQGFNYTEFSSEHQNLFIALFVLFVCTIIIVSGYLLIYNIMYISVNHDIRFFGMLKTIGATAKQIKKMVIYQSLRLSAVGIPAGMLIGTGIMFVAVPYSMKMFDSDITKMVFNPFIYVGTIAFSLITVLISCRKPAGFAGNISPIEAFKYNGQQSGKIKKVSTTDGGKIHKMAWRNIFREKKRAFIVIGSLFMGLLVLIVTQTFLKGLDLENYADTYIPFDFSIYTQLASSDDFKQIDSEKTKDAFKLADDIGKIDGVTNVMINLDSDVSPVFDRDVFMPFIRDVAGHDKESDADSIADMFENNTSEVKFSSPVIAIDSDMMKLHNKKTEQKIDIDRFERGEVCFVGYLGDKAAALSLKGKNITLKNEENGKTKEIEIDVCADDNDRFGFEIGSYWVVAGAPSCILVSQNVLDDLSAAGTPNSIIAECTEKSENFVKTELTKLCLKSSCVPSTAHIQVRSDMIADFKSSIMSMKIVTTGISSILIVIGVVNFVNVMLTGVISRRKELAVLESIGMTGKQIRNMLTLEGLIYALIETLLLMTVGNAAIYLTSVMAVNIADYAVFHYPFMLITVLILLIFIICFSMPSVAYKISSAVPVTERLRIDD